MSDCSSVSTEVTVLETSWPLDADAGVLDRTGLLFLEGIFPNSLPPLGIFTIKELLSQQCGQRKLS